MKHPYRVPVPAAEPSTPHGETTAATHGGGAAPSLPHEHDESSHSQAQGTAGQQEVGEKAYRNATDGTTDTDKGPAMDKVYNSQVAPDRGATPPRR